jgi:hypothetical protein
MNEEIRRKIRQEFKNMLKWVLKKQFTRQLGKRY